MASTKTIQPPEVQPNNHSIKPWLIAAAVLVGAFMLINATIWFAYMGRSYPGVKVGNQSVGNLTGGAITAQLGNYTSDYSIETTVKDSKYTVTPQDIGISYNIQKSSEAVLAVGKQQWLPVHGFVQAWLGGSAKLEYDLNKEQLARKAAELAGTSSVPPTDAKVTVEGEMVRVEADKDGQGVDAAVLAELLQQTAATGSQRATIGERATKAAVTTSEAEETAVRVRKTIALPVRIEVNGRVFSPGAAEVGTWLAITPKDGTLTVGVNVETLNAYIATVAGQVDVAAVNKKISMVNGEVRNISEGKNGLALDKAAVATALTGAVTAGGSATVSGKLNPVSFKTLTNNSVDIAGKYIEINLSRQQMWAYEEKKVVRNSPITSGATGAGYPTIQGLFKIYGKQTNRNLNGYAIGYDYNVFVKYWMPFSGNYGLHDASWRTKFGGQDYYYGGSHGCVNLPLGMASWLYNWAPIGTPVWVHS